MSSKHGLTQRGHNLGLQAKLLLETGRNVANSTSPVASDVRNLADVVEHVSAGEEQDRDEADGGPEVSALEDGHHVRVGNVECSCTSENDGDAGNPSHPVNGSLHGRMRSAWEMTGEPNLDLLGSRGSDDSRLLHAQRKQKANVSYPVVKSYRKGSCFATA